MENSTKALLIAAAVLITIIIISLGLMIIRSSNESLNSSKGSLSEVEKYSFNSKFTSFEGKRNSASKTVQLLKTINTSNSSNDNKIVVKLNIRNEVYDTDSYVLLNADTGNTEKCNSSNKINLNEMIDKVSKNLTYNYSVTLYYCNSKTRKISNNRNFNLVEGCVFLVHIQQNK